MNSSLSFGTKVIPLYLQIIGRALTCIDTDKINELGIVPQIFDIVDSLETLRRRFPYKIINKNTSNYTSIPSCLISEIADINIEVAKQSSFQILSDLQEVINKQISWDDAYKIATEFYTEHGNLNVRKNTILHNFDLYSWVNHERYLHNNSSDSSLQSTKQYSKEKTLLLEQIGMDWDYEHTLLERLGFIKNVSFNFLVKYQEYTNALCSENIENAKRWWYRQYDKSRKGKLSNSEKEIVDNHKTFF